MSHERADAAATAQDPAVSDLQAAAARPGSILATFRAVAWSFFGIRRSADYERDVAHLNPVHVVVAGIVGALVFVGVLIVLVNWVVSSSASP